MQISYNWLMNYLPVSIPLDKLSEILTNIGLEVEGTEVIEAVKGGLKGVVVGEVRTCEPHPNADKLRITTVDIGAEALLNIVCGAPNVAAGQKVLVATIGTTLYDQAGNAFQIKPAKIRGEASQGMICAEDELGIGTSHDGIMVLPSDTVIGTPAAEYLNLPTPETVIHIGLTPNRSDAMSHIGVARDVISYINHHEKKSYQVQVPAANIGAPNATLPIHIEIEAADACHRFSGLTIEGVQVGPSPEWLSTHLKTIGVKPINNIVDITNFVLHEYGQPLHAYDYDHIAKQQIKIGYLSADTPFTTLDSKERKLRAEDLMIQDGQKPISLAGIMGGLHSGVSDNTKNIFLESAFFDPKTIRRSSLHHLLRTDAATHFEKVVNIDLVVPALHRAAALIIDIAGGKIASETHDLYPVIHQHEEVSFRYDYISLLCGKNYATIDIDNILASMGFKIISQDATSCTVQVPFSKSDIKQAADIAEEILRIDGLNNVPIHDTITFSLSANNTSPERALREKASQWLTDKGFNEIITNSIVNAANYPEAGTVKMLNSLTTELNAMRPAMLPSGLEVLEYNINRGNKHIMMYEWGNVYNQEAVGKYHQHTLLALWTTGNVQAAHWQQAAQPQDIYYLKGIIESLAKLCGISQLKYQVKEDTIEYINAKQVIAKVSIVDSLTLKKAGIKQGVFYAEIHVEHWLKAMKPIVKYKEVNKYPQVERDLSILVDKNVTYQQIEQIIKTKQFNTLQSYTLFDIFEGEKIGNDKRAWALNYIFQADDKTLTDDEIDQMMQSLIKDFEQKLQATIRK